MNAALKLTTEYKSSLAEFAAVHFAPDPAHVGNVIVECRYSSDVFRRVFYCAADRLPERLEDLKLQKWDYYITANSFSGGDRQAAALFTLHNIVIDIDAHGDALSSWQRAHMIDSLAYFAESDLQTVPNTIVKTGRGVQLWYAIEPISYKAAHKYNTVRDQLIGEVEQLIRDVPALAGLHLDPGASHNTAGLFRLPGSYNSKTDAEGSLHRIRDERLIIPEEYARITAGQIIKPGAKVQQMPKGGADALQLAQFREGRLRQLLRLRKAEGQQPGEELRDHFVFCMYNSWASVLQDHDQAMKRAEAINREFVEPLTDRELRLYLTTSERKRYTLTNSKIIDMLAITQEEQTAIGLYPAGSGKTDRREQLRQDARDAKAERDARILELFDQGMQQKDIAAEVGCSAPTVGNVIKRHGRTTRREELHTKICQLIREGKAPAEVAGLIGCSLSTVYDHIRKAREAGQDLAVDDEKESAGQFIDRNFENVTEDAGVTEERNTITDVRPADDRWDFVLHDEFRQIKKPRIYKGAIPGHSVSPAVTLETVREKLACRRPISDPAAVTAREKLLATIRENRLRRARLGIAPPG